MYYRKLVALAAALVMVFSAVWVASATPKVKDENEQRSLQTIEPLNLAILIQDDLVPQVGNEIKITRDFIRSLPQGSQVMVGYITAGSLQVRQPFTTDLEKAARSLRIPLGSTASSPFNPYVEVVDRRHRSSDQGSQQARRIDIQFLRAVGWFNEPQPYRGELWTKFVEPHFERNWWPSVLPGHQWFRNVQLVLRAFARDVEQAIRARSVISHGVVSCRGGINMPPLFLFRPR